MKKTLLLALTAVFSGLLTAPATAQWSGNAQLNTVVKDAAGTNEVTPRIATLPDGSSYVSWFESAPTINYQMRLQRLDANGNKLWGPDGIVVSANANSTTLFRYDLKVDQQGNALLGFQDARTGVSQCVIYKISPTGTQLWGANGIALLDATATTGLSPTIAVTNSNNVVVCWNSSGTAGSWISFQKFSPSGTALWPAVQRIQGTTATERYDRPYPMPVGTDDVLLPHVRRTGTGTGVSTLMARRYNAAGTAVWAAPVQVSTKPVGFTFFPEPVSDGNDGYFVALNSGNPANATLGDVYVQHVTSTGTLWSTDGTEALTGTATARFDGKLQYVAARNELWLALNVRNTSQSESGVSLQKFEAGSGSALLGAAGVTVLPVTAAVSAAVGFRNTGSGLLIVYTEALSAVNNVIKATKTTYTGAPAWTAGSISVAGVSSPKLQFGMDAFAGDQLVVSWQDNRQDNGIYAQNVRNDGQLGLVTAAHQAKAAQPLALYPNPGATATLRLALPQAQPVTLCLRDLTGRVVQQRRVVLPAGVQDVPLRAEHVAAGLYVVDAEVAGQVLRTTWVKQ